MVDKLQIEIDFHDSRSAVFALIHLANVLAESATVSIKDDNDWEEHEADEYSVKWRFTELSPSAEIEYDPSVLVVPKRKVSTRQSRYFSRSK